MKALKLLKIGEVKLAKDNRSYYTAEFSDPSNPFARSVSRNFWQQLNAAGEPVWKGADPAVVKPFVGKTIPGEIITAKVEPYTIAREGKEDYEASTYTSVVLGNELPEVVFASLGHKMTSNVAAAEEIENAVDVQVM